MSADIMAAVFTEGFPAAVLMEAECKGAGEVNDGEKENAQ